MAWDPYAQGMSEFKEQDFDSIKKLTHFEYSLFAKYLGARVLEVGAGWGRVTELVLEKHRPLEMGAIEPSSDLFGKLVSRLRSSEKLTLYRAEVADLLIKYPQYFDTSFSVHVLEHIEDDQRFIEDSIALLRSKGKLIILVPALQFLYSNLDRNIGHYRRYDKKMIRKLVAGKNVKIEKLFYSNFLGVLASLYFLKFKNLEYQSSEKKEQFIFLFKLYDRFFIPMIALLEKYLSVPIGLNLTVVLEKY